MNRRWYLRRLAFLARRLGFGRNPLRRTIDRAESLMLLGAALITVAVVPFALSVGTVVAQRELATAAAQTAQRHQVTAVLTADAPLTVAATGVSTPVQAPARWTDTAGAFHIGMAPAAPGEAAGSRVPIWTDNTGSLASSPLSAAQAKARGMMAVVGVMAGVIALLGSALGFVHTRLNRARARTWEAEWRIIGPRWTTRAN